MRAEGKSVMVVPLGVSSLEKDTRVFFKKKVFDGTVIHEPVSDAEIFFTWNAATTAAIPLMIANTPKIKGMSSAVKIGRIRIMIPKIMQTIPSTALPISLDLNA